jgi:hypothetical protein
MIMTRATVKRKHDARQPNGELELAGHLGEIARVEPHERIGEEHADEHERSHRRSSG